MPKRVLGGFRIYVWLRGERGHRPHVHVFGNSGEIVVQLDPVAERERHGIKDAEARRALRIVAKHRDELLEFWRVFHGDEDN